MRLKSTFLALLIALSLIFSGCLGFLEGDDPEVEDEDEDQMDHDNMDHDDMDHDDKDNGNDGGSKNGTGDPPVASLAANLTEGPASLAVNFTIDAEHEQPETLSWSIDFDDGADAETGDGVPANVEHNFDAAGNYTVVLTVSHGDTSDETNVTITVTEAAGSEPNALQEGTNGLCLDYNVLYEVPGADDPLATRVDVDPGTGIEIHSDDGFVFVDFFDADDASVGYYPSDSVNTVPENAAYGVVCVGLEEGPGYPALPAPNAAWTYQDGFEPTD